MPEPSGSEGCRYFAQKKYQTDGLNQILGKRSIMHRRNALRRISALLSANPAVTEEALYLMWLFHFHPDDLTEAGVPFEVVKALERQHPFLLSNP